MGHGIGPGKCPDCDIRCTDSADGITGWSPPRVFADATEGFLDDALARGGEGWVRVLARGSNLHATPDFPGPGLWWITAARPSTDRADWSTRGGCSTPTSRALPRGSRGEPTARL